MKKLFIIIAAMTMVFVSCTKDKKETPVVPTPTIAEQIVGKWLYIECDDNLVPTNEISTTSFVMEGSTLKAYISQSVDKYELWAYNQPADVQIDGNKIVVTMQKDNITTMEEYSDITVGSDDMSYTSMYTFILNGEAVEDFGPFQLRCAEVDDEYTQDIIGLWECTELTGGVTFNDDNARLEFMADGTYNYYRKDEEGVWQLIPREMNEYFVDGDFLATRWNALGERVKYESWVIASLEEGNMDWYAIRLDAEGNTFEQVMKWMKIE